MRIKKKIIKLSKLFLFLLCKKKKYLLIKNNDYKTIAIYYLFI